MSTTHLLYLHGFRSSPRSAKAVMVAEHVTQHHPAVHFWSPQLPPSPKGAMAEIAERVADWPSAQMAVIGSSLGGFYASWVAHHKGCRSVMLNPATHPARDLERYIGEQTAWHEPAERFFFLPEYISELQALDVSASPPSGPELLIAAEGDEVLDWKEMLARYPAAQHKILKGGDHALSDFSQHLAEVIAFCQLA